jgi:hypothetical protein
MAGLFKNIERVLAASNFATNAHRFIVRHSLARTNAAEYYFDPSVRSRGLPKTHEFDAHQLAIVALSLARQTSNYQKLLQEAQSGNHEAVVAEL